MYKRAIIVVLVLLAVAACSSQSAKVVGLWSDGADGSFEFRPDNTLIVKDSPQDQNPVSGKWEAYPDGRIRIDIFTPAGHKIATIAYVQDNDNIIMELKNKPYSLVRMKSK